MSKRAPLFIEKLNILLNFWAIKQTNQNLLDEILLIVVLVMCGFGAIPDMLACNILPMAKAYSIC